jgi:hypothetical protein
MLFVFFQFFLSNYFTVFFKAQYSYTNPTQCTDGFKYFSPITTCVTYETCSNLCTEKNTLPLNIYYRQQKWIPSTDVLKQIVIGSTWLSLRYGGVSSPFQWSDSSNRNFPDMGMLPWSTSDVKNNRNFWGYGNCNGMYDKVQIDTNQKWHVADSCTNSLCVCQIPCTGTC